jgi:hypothetical protein
MTSAEKAIQSFMNGCNFDDAVMIHDCESFGSYAADKIAIFSDGSAIRGGDYSITEIEASEAEIMIAQQ